MKRFALSALLTAICIASVAAGATATQTQDRVILKTILTGAAEVPGPGDPDGIGKAKIKLAVGGSTICFKLRVAHITLPATGAHIHAAPVGVAGPVVVPLTPPDASGRSHGCVTADPALVAAIIHHPDQYYVNVHTTDFPGGAIRGQLG
jgi:hypothetical protein